MREGLSRTQVSGHVRPNKNLSWFLIALAMTRLTPRRKLGIRLAGRRSCTIGKSGPLMKLPRDFYKPLAIGAPHPARELPVRLERMIHFVPPHVEKLRAKVPELVGRVDVVLGNLEDAIPADAKEAARHGFIIMAKG